MSEAKSLLNCFLPPRDDLKGQFGLLCGFSATPDFMSKALEYFTTYSDDQRAMMGSFNLVLFLDKRASQITSVPGLRQELFHGDESVFDLMHAKVGMLTFAKDKYAKIENIRIIVSTGNWTTQGMLENLDHLWTLDLHLNDPNPQALAEYREVLLFFNKLKSNYSKIQPTEQLFSKLNDLVTDSLPPRSETLFFSSYSSEAESSLAFIDLIAKRMHKSDGVKAFNQIGCASGFYEEETDGNLKVFQAIEEKIYGNGSFTKNPTAFIVANPKDYKKFTNSNLKNLDLEWSVVPVKDPRDKAPIRTFLHSKFIFAGFINSVNVAHGKIYLGSANLSRKAMLTKFGTPNSNIEAGVVLDYPRISLDESQKTLAIGDVDLTESELLELAGPPQNEFENSPTIFAPPILSINNFNLSTGLGDIQWGRKPEDCFYFNNLGAKIEVAGNSSQINLSSMRLNDSQLTLTAVGNQRQFIVPIIGQDGAYCQRAPEQHDAESILNLLLSFPDSIEKSDEDLIQNLNTSIQINSLKADENLHKQRSGRTLNLAMELIEAVSRKNHMISQGEINAWIERLFFTLTRCLTLQAKEEFAKININFLSLLKVNNFAPPWQSLNAGSAQIESYDKMIDRIASDWQINQYPPLGQGVK